MKEPKEEPFLIFNYPDKRYCEWFWICHEYEGVCIVKDRIGGHAIVNPYMWRIASTSAGDILQFRTTDNSDWRTWGSYSTSICESIKDRYALSSLEKAIFNDENKDD